MIKSLNKTTAVLIALLMCVSAVFPILTLSEAQTQEITPPKNPDKQGKIQLFRERVS